MSAVRLRVSHDDLDTLAEKSDGRGKNATVPKELLRKFVLDYGTLFNHLKDENIQIEGKTNDN